MLRAFVLTLAGVLLSTTLNAQQTVSRGADMGVDVAADGRLAIDLLGDLWIVPGNGGDARQLTENLKSVRRPRWSPNGEQLVYQAIDDGRRGLWIYDLNDRAARSISAASGIETQPSWHPSGERLVFSADVDGSGFDLWELDVATGVRWRLSHFAGDESEAAWSRNGRDLVYVHQHNKKWSLVLRRHGRTEEVLLTSATKIAAPSWRPDGSLITFFRDTGGKRVIDMVILSSPRLVRRFADNEAFDLSPVSWLDRQKLFYSAAGQIRSKSFAAWRSRPVLFRASLQARAEPQRDRERIALGWHDEPTGNLIIHAARLYDGIGNDYQHGQDVHIEGGRITTIKPHADHGGAIAIDLGDLAILPGFIDADARLPTDLTPSHGPDLLTMGITTIVAGHPDAERLNLLWSGKNIPGPRFLDAEKWPLGNVAQAEVDVTAAVVTSRNTGMPAGEALGTQFRTMQVAGLTAVQTLRSVGANAAGQILADPYLGRITVGSAADLVFVDGDPLTNIDDALNVVAVVRNGRFFSVSGLIDRAKSAETVD